MKSKLIALILSAAIGIPAVGAVASTTAHPATDADGTSSTTVPPTTSTSDASATAIEAAIHSDADLQAACTRDGKELAEKEAAGTITPLEQAALDALRPICADNDTPLPAAPQPEQPVQVVTIVEQAAPATTVQPASSYQDDDDDEHEEREDREHEDHEDDD